MKKIIVTVGALCAFLTAADAMRGLDYSQQAKKANVKLQPGDALGAVRFQRAEECVTGEKDSKKSDTDRNKDFLGRIKGEEGTALLARVRAASDQLKGTPNQPISGFRSKQLVTAIQRARDRVNADTLQKLILNMQTVAAGRATSSTKLWPLFEPYFGSDLGEIANSLRDLPRDWQKMDIGLTYWLLMIVGTCFVAEGGRMDIDLFKFKSGWTKNDPAQKLLATLVLETKGGIRVVDDTSETE